MAYIGQPELLSGTIRHNLDIFGQYDDAALNDALRAAGLLSSQGVSDETRFTLDTEISSGGGNLSVGQRQMIALARAIVRQSKLLILDEATSAIGWLSPCSVSLSLSHEFLFFQIMRPMRLFKSYFVTNSGAMSPLSLSHIACKPSWTPIKWYVVCGCQFYGNEC